MKTTVGKFARLWAGVVLLLFCQLCSADWWNDEWSYRKKVAFDPATLALGQALPDEITLLLRLHPANFNYFVDMREDGSDLRFIAGDGITPLKYHIETFDAAAGIGVIWVRVPRPAATLDSFWMYYGNAEAASASEPNASFGADQTLALHFAEKEGLPLDSTAFAHHPSQFNGQLQAAGQIDAGAGFSPSTQLLLPESPALALDSARGNTLSFWLRLERNEDGRVALLRQGDDANNLTLDIQGNRLRAELMADKKPYLLETVTVLGVNRWYHVGLTMGGEVLEVYLDGASVGSLKIPAVKSSGSVMLGTRNGVPGFAGIIDELQLDAVARSAAQFRLAAISEVAEGSPVTYGEDEVRESSSGMSEYFGLLLSLAEVVTLDGWIIILIIAAFGVAAVDVVITKTLMLNRTGHADDLFHAGFRQQTGAALLASQGASGKEAEAYAKSVLFQIYQAGTEEYGRFAQDTSGRRMLGAEGLQALRATMEAQVVKETDKLNSRLVALLLAVSAGPFLGLLGTVVGVMLTFAAIAKLGDVNINTIAPGVAAALTTTVAGLVVAIPSLFGYNYVAGRIGSRIALMEVFIDQYISKLALASQAEQAARQEVQRHVA